MYKDFLYDYYQIDSFCKSERLNTEYFIVTARSENKKRRWKGRTRRPKEGYAR